MQDSFVSKHFGRVQRFVRRTLPDCVFIHINKTAGSSIERGLALRFEHKTAMEKWQELGEFRWRRAFKFTFVRNPWDKVVSHYAYRVKTNQTAMGDGHVSFREWVLRAYGAHDRRYYDQPMMFQPQWSWISDATSEQNCMVDFIGRFENLAADYAAITHRLGRGNPLPHEKQSPRQAYQDYYDSETRECIADCFAIDLERLGYRFSADTSVAPSGLSSNL